MDEVLSSGQAYQFTLLEEWKTLIAWGREFRTNYLEGRCDPTTINAYVASLTNFYEILAPKVHSNLGQPGWKELIKKFDDWSEWVKNPTWFQTPGSMDRIFELRDVIGDVVEKLDVTYFKQGRT